MGQIRYMGALLMIVLFAIAIVGFTFNFADDNNVYVDLENDSELSYTKSSAESNVILYKGDVSKGASALMNSSIESGDETTATGGVFKGNIANVYNAFKDYMGFAYTKVFGGEQGNAGFGIIFTAFLSFLTFIGILYIWQTWAGKNPSG